MKKETRTQVEIDACNLRFYARLFREYHWQTDVMHWSVFAATCRLGMKSIPDCYDYVRRYYAVPAYIGKRVRVGGKEGVIVKANGSQQYVHIRLDDAKHANPYHPTDGIEYLES